MAKKVTMTTPTTTVKIEVIEHDDDVSMHHFLDGSFKDSGGDDGAYYFGDNEEKEDGGTSSKRRRRRRRDTDEDSDDRDYSTGGQKPKRKAGAGKKRKGGHDQGQNNLSRSEQRKEQRAKMTPEEQEKLREKWKLEKQQRRKLEKQRKDEEKGLRSLVGEDEDEGQVPSRPLRQARLKSTAKVKAEPDDIDVGDGGDDDYQMVEEEDDDDDEKSDTKKKRSPRKSSSGTSIPRSSTGGRRKRVSEMSEEEREIMKEKWRLEARERRARQRAALGDAIGRDAVKKEEVDTNNKRTTSSSRSRISSSEGPVDIREKWREEARRKRQRKRESMTPEEYEEHLRIQREQKRARRALLKPQMTDAQREERNRRTNELRQVRVALMTPEKKREERQKEYIRRILRQSRMTDEEKNNKRMNNYMLNAAKMSEMSSEEVEKIRQRKRDYHKFRRSQMTEEQRQKWRETVRRCMKRRRDRIKQDPEKMEEMRKMWKRHRDNYMAKKGRSQRETRRRTVIRTSKINPNETPEEKRERLRRYQKVQRLRKKLEIKKMLEEGVAVEEIQMKIKKETPEKRDERLMKQRIRAAKNRLKKQLEQSGACPQEIEKRCQELELTYQPKPTKPYRPRGLVKIESRELSLLEGLEHSNDQAPEAVPSPPKKPQRSPKKELRIDGVTSSHLKQQPHYSQSSSCSPDAYQQMPAHAHSSNHQYLQQYHYQAPVAYPHQMPQAPSFSFPRQAYPSSRQTILDGNPYQESRGALTSGSPITALHHHHQVGDHSNDDYSSSYNDHSPPPASPVGGYDDDDNDPNEYSNYTDYSLVTPQPPPPSKKRRPRQNDDPSRPKKRRTRTSARPPGTVHGRIGPHGSRLKTRAPDSVCDECGNAYDSKFLAHHKACLHNPNYKDQTCQICQEKFTNSKFWYRHYRREHKHLEKPVIIDKPKPHICDLCGQGFDMLGNLNTHKYYQHGEGQKKENYFRCPVCPAETLFKKVYTLHVHLKRKHPEYNREGTKECSRCDRTFPDDKELRSHVKEQHPDSYFPCLFCTSVRFSRHAVFFHYVWCPKFPKDRKEEFRNKEVEEMDGAVGLYRLPLPCEFCGKDIAVRNLNKHFWEAHGVREEEFRCAEEGCGKGFKRREYWTVHLEEIHGKGVDELREFVGKFNVQDRGKVEVKNVEGKHGGIRFNTKQKLAKLTLEGAEGERGRKKKVKEERMEEETSSSGGEEDKKDVPEKGGGRGKRRNILVIADEDEQDL